MSKKAQTLPPDYVRDGALIFELETAIGLAKLGLSSLNSARNRDYHYHVILLLLSSALERMLKVMICIDHKRSKGAFPTTVELKKLGHNLSGLLDVVTEQSFFGNAWLRTVAGRSDYDFLKGDLFANQIIPILSHFGQGGRYSDLNVVAGEIPADHPVETWMRKMSNHDFSARTFERAFRAFTRWFTLGGGAPEAKKLQPVVKDFLILRDEQLGTINWTLQT